MKHKTQRGNISPEITPNISLTHQQQAASSVLWVQSLAKLFHHSLRFCKIQMSQALNNQLRGSSSRNHVRKTKNPNGKGKCMAILHMSTFIRAKAEFWAWCTQLKYRKAKQVLRDAFWGGLSKMSSIKQSHNSLLPQGVKPQMGGQDPPQHAPCCKDTHKKKIKTAWRSLQSEIMRHRAAGC